MGSLWLPSPAAFKDHKAPLVAGMRKVCLAVDDSPVGKDTVSWAAKYVLHPGSSDEEVHIVSVLEPAVRSGAVTAAESGHPTGALLLQEREREPLGDGAG